MLRHERILRQRFFAYPRKPVASASPSAPWPSSRTPFGSRLWGLKSLALHGLQRPAGSAVLALHRRRLGEASAVAARNQSIPLACRACARGRGYPAAPRPAVMRGRHPGGLGHRAAKPWSGFAPGSPARLAGAATRHRAGMPSMGVSSACFALELHREIKRKKDARKRRKRQG